MGGDGWVFVCVRQDGMTLHIPLTLSPSLSSPLSDTVSETRGIGAARRWIRSTFEAYSEKLSVEFDFFTIPQSSGIPFDTETTNVIATLPGTCLLCSSFVNGELPLFTVGIPVFFLGS